MLHASACACACKGLLEFEMMVACRSSSAAVHIHNCLSLSQSCSVLLLQTLLPQWLWLHVRYVTCYAHSYITLLHGIAFNIYQTSVHLSANLQWLLISCADIHAIPGLRATC